MGSNPSWRTKIKLTDKKFRVNFYNGAMKVIMARRVPLSKMDRSFDLKFWEKVGVEGKWEAAWDMTIEVQRIRGENGDQPRLQRSVQNIKRVRY